MKIALIDDDVTFYSRFHECLPTDVVDRMELDCYQDLTDKLYEKTYDIVFLDVMLFDAESFEKGSMIKRFSSDTTLVYISNYDHFVYDSLRQDSYFFIRKSKLVDDVSDFFVKYNKQLSKQNEVLIVRHAKGDLQVPQYKILYLEANKNYAIVKTEKMDYAIYDSLKMIVKQLNTEMFYRLNGHYVVNMRNILSVETDYIVMTNQEKIYFTRGSKAPFLKAYMIFRGNELWNG